ncbi:MAG: phenylacetate--CoA ligase family protein [Bacillota bacterium]
MIWTQDETLARSELADLQLIRLQETVHRVYDTVPHYRQAFDKARVRPEEIRGLDDLQKLPFTTKEDLRCNYPYGLFTVPLKDIVRIHASSGTTGKPTVVGYTQKDIHTWTELIARLATMAGVTNEDVAQIYFGYGLFTGAFGLHYGLERIGATVVPASGGNTEKQIMLMQDFGTTVLVGTPSYALHMADVAESMGVDISRLKLRMGMFGAEPCTEEMRREIERRWSITATDNYGLSEVIGPGVSGECLHKEGLHLAEDHFIAEIIDPETMEPLDYGERGELVLTTITKEGLPVIRYRTRDITTLNPDRCKCGRTTARMRKVTGRTDDMLVVRGVNVFPSQIESVLMEMDGVAPHYQILVRKSDHLDDIEVQVEATDDMISNRNHELGVQERKIRDRLHTVLSLSASVKLVEPGSLTRWEGKARRVIDMRGTGEGMMPK